MAKPIDVYSAGTPNGDKVHIFVEEAGIPYVAHTVNIRVGEQTTPEYLRINPNNKIPAIVDPEGPDGKPITIFESGAVLIYLADKVKKFIPPESDVRRRVEVLQWLFFQVGGVGPMMGQYSHFNGLEEKNEYAINRYKNEVKRIIKVLDTHLADKEWLAAGEYTIADMMNYPWVENYLKIVGENFPNVDKWLHKIAQRPAIAKAKTLCRIDNLPNPKEFGTFKKQ